MSRVCILLLVLALSGGALAVEVPTSPVGQLGAEIDWIAVPGAEDLFHAVQMSRDGRLILTPNESFFPRLGLVAAGEGSALDVAGMNGGRSFASIEKWDSGDAAEWGLWLTKSGKVQASVHLSGGSGRFTLSLGQQSESFSIRAGDRPAEAVIAAFEISALGRHLLRLSCDEGGSGVSLRWIDVRAEGGVIRKRWRPAAAHTKFSSSHVPGRVRLWVMEMDAVPGELDFYSPITTPFGYYGPTWRADGTVNTGFNFSLWSFGRNQPEPPVERLSHLLAIGNPTALFGGFDHEGTGVKIRAWEPLEGRQGQRQALALRVEPGERYDTYFSYFYADDEKRWRLFGAGNKWNDGKPIGSLWVGSFVEVPGPPHTQRSGAWERTMRYRGWVMDDGGQWSALDRMERGNIDRETGLTHTDRGETADGWFYLRTGGWTFRMERELAPVELAAPAGPGDVDYLGEEDIAYLTSVPCELAVTSLTRAETGARIDFSVRNAGQNAKIFVHWGKADGLTFADRWAHRVEVTEAIREGANRFEFDGLPGGEPLFVRLLLINDEGQFWSSESRAADF